MRNLLFFILVLLTTSVFADQKPFAITIRGHYAYASCGLDGVQIIDISDPQKPILVKKFSNIDKARRVVLVDNYMYVANCNSLEVIDISDPESANLIATHKIPACDIAMFGNYLCVVCENGLEFLIFDISNPQKFKQINHVSQFCQMRCVDEGGETKKCLKYKKNNVVLSGNIAYIAAVDATADSSSSAIIALDISDHRYPVIVYVIKLPENFVIDDMLVFKKNVILIARNRQHAGSDIVCFCVYVDYGVLAESYEIYRNWSEIIRYQLPGNCFFAVQHPIKSRFFYITKQNQPLYVRGNNALFGSFDTTYTLDLSFTHSTKPAIIESSDSLLITRVATDCQVDELDECLHNRLIEGKENAQTYDLYQQQNSIKQNEVKKLAKIFLLLLGMTEDSTENQFVVQ